MAMTNNDIRYNRVKNELNRVKDELEPTTKNDLRVDWESYKDVDGNSLDDLILEVLQNNFDCGNTYGYKVADEIIGLLPSVTPQEPRWIPVTEKRPVEFEKVLVTYKLRYDNSIHVGIGNIVTNDVNGRYHWNINEQDYIGWDMLAWMPLPEPYEGGE